MRGAPNTRPEPAAYMTRRSPCSTLGRFAKPEKSPYRSPQRRDAAYQLGSVIGDLPVPATFSQERLAWAAR
jgi:hypothetical protein